MGINFRNVGFKYNRGDEEYTLKDINFSISPQNELIMILGHTGSGKSTLVQHMNALLFPLEGEVFVFDKVIGQKKKESLKDVRKKVGLVFQFPEYQLFEETVIKDVMFGPRNFGKSHLDAKLAAEQACLLVGITEDLWERSPFSLSGGQMRRVAIAGILASDPDILILDEPTVGLDPVGKVDLMTLLLEIQSTTKKSIIIISHDMNIVAKYAKRLIVLDQGKIVYDGEKRPLFEDFRRLKSFNLDLPDSARIAIELKKKQLIDYQQLPLTLEELLQALKAGAKDE